MFSRGLHGAVWLPGAAVKSREQKDIAGIEVCVLFLFDRGILCCRLGLGKAVGLYVLCVSAVLASYCMLHFVTTLHLVMGVCYMASCMKSACNILLSRGRQLLLWHNLHRSGHTFLVNQSRSGTSFGRHELLGRALPLFDATAPTHTPQHAHLAEFGI